MAELALDDFEDAALLAGDEGDANFAHLGCGIRVAMGPLDGTADECRPQGMTVMRVISRRPALLHGKAPSARRLLGTMETFRPNS